MHSLRKGNKVEILMVGNLTSMKLYLKIPKRGEEEDETEPAKRCIRYSTLMLP